MCATMVFQNSFFCIFHWYGRTGGKYPKPPKNNRRVIWSAMDQIGKKKILCRQFQGSNITCPLNLYAGEQKKTLQKTRGGSKWTENIFFSPPPPRRQAMILKMNQYLRGFLSLAQEPSTFLYYSMQADISFLMLKQYLCL